MERMMHGVDALEPYLTDEDRRLLRKVMISECDWLLDRYEIVAGLYAHEGKNKPESNLWNGAFLCRTAERYPDCPRAEEYRDKGIRFLLNSISVPADAASDEAVDGKAVADCIAGANFFDSFALNHHGYLNVGYMVICLSNMAMLHFMYRTQGKPAPASLYRHGEELWRLVKTCTFPDGRLLRIGGDTRVRYSYCQDYAIPVWLMAEDLYGDAGCRTFEAEWLRQVELEMQASGDGTFLSCRAKAMAQRSPLYFTRLESDRAAALSMGLAWRGLIDRGSPKASETAIWLDSWHDPYHGAYLHRSAKRICSWVWEAAEKPQGLCLPADASSMAEWRENLAGKIEGLGKISAQHVESHGGATFGGGFLTWGQSLVRTQGLQAEGRSEEDIARQWTVCAALPDDTHMVVLQFAEALDRRIFVRGIKGLYLHVPNDVFNGSRRRYYHRGGQEELQGAGNTAAEVFRPGSSWINVDDRLGVLAVYGPPELFVCRPGRRQIGLKASLRTEEPEGTLYADEICGPWESGLRSADANAVLLDAGYVLQAGVGHGVSDTYSGSKDFLRPLETDRPFVRGIWVRGADGMNYLTAANFGKVRDQVQIHADRPIWDCTAGRSLQPDESGRAALSIEPGQAVLIRA